MTVKDIPELIQKIKSELEICAADLVVSNPVINEPHYKGQVYAYRKILKMLGQDVRLIAEVRGGGKS